MELPALQVINVDQEQEIAAVIHLRTSDLGAIVTAEEPTLVMEDLLTQILFITIWTILRMRVNTYSPPSKNLE